MTVGQRQSVAVTVTVTSTVAVAATAAATGAGDWPERQRHSRSGSDRGSDCDSDSDGDSGCDRQRPSVTAVSLVDEWAGVGMSAQWRRSLWAVDVITHSHSTLCAGVACASHTESDSQPTAVRLSQRQALAPAPSTVNNGQPVSRSRPAIVIKRGVVQGIEWTTRTTRSAGQLDGPPACQRSTADPRRACVISNDHERQKLLWSQNNGVLYKMLQQFDDLRQRGDRTQISSSGSLTRSLLGRQHEQAEHGDEDKFQRRIVGQINGQLADLRKIAEEERQRQRQQVSRQGSR